MFADLPRRQVNQKVLLLQIYAKIMRDVEERFYIANQSFYHPRLFFVLSFLPDCARQAKAGIRKIIFILTPRRKGFLKFRISFNIRLPPDSMQFNRWILHNALRNSE